jgi:pimeloyl-ACP methyl ester carboxylesterase
MTNIRSSGLLGYALVANAIFSALSGVVITLSGGRIASFLGLHPLVSLWPVGLALVLFAAYVFVAARKSDPDSGATQAIIISDVLWVFGSIALILFGPLSTRGNAAVAVVALVVLAFAVLQSAGIQKVRQQVQGRSRKIRFWSRRLFLVGSAVLGVLLLGGAVYEDVRAAGDAEHYPPPGKLVDIGGYRLHLDCVGQGSPTVVIDAGAGNWSVAWTGIQDQLVGETRICTFDRAGLGWSDPGIRPRTSLAMADELYLLLHNAGIPPPFVMVGHSLGGYNARVFTDRHRNEVAGLVLVDSAHEGQWRALPIEVSEFKDDGLHQLYVAKVIARLGLLHLLNVSNPQVDRVPSVLRPAYRANLAQAKIYDAWHSEMQSVDKSAAEVNATRSIGDLPLVVVSAGHSFDAFKRIANHIPFDKANKTWLDLQSDLARLSSNTTQLIDPAATHDINFDDPDLIVKGIRIVLSKVRDHDAKEKQVLAGD